jgi:hypothetical protein
MTENENSTWGILEPHMMDQFWLEQMRARICSGEEAAVRQIREALQNFDRTQPAVVRQLQVVEQTIDPTAVVQIPQSIYQIDRSLLPARAELPPVMLTVDGRVDFSYIRARVVGIPFSTVVGLFEYWKTNPPLHELLAIAMKLADGADCNASRTVQQQPPYPDQANTSSSRQRRRACKYEAIDKTLGAIAKARPKNHREVFQQLDARNVDIPTAEPFKFARTWIAGFEKDPARAHAWLSKRWSGLRLTPFPRGPK